MKNILIISFLCLPAISQNYSGRFEKANEHYTLEEYAAAIEIYEDIIESVDHENIYYNLGNSYFRIGDIGNSIWAYEKALELSPRDSDINFNLKYLRSRVRDRILPPEDMYLISLYKSILLKFNLQDILLFIGLIFLLLSAKYVLNNFSSILNPINHFINYFALLLIIFYFWMALDKYWDVSDKNHGIITASAVDVRSSPLDRGENVVFRIHEGTKVEIHNLQAGWSEIMLLDGKKGWIFSKDIRNI